MDQTLTQALTEVESKFLKTTKYTSSDEARLKMFSNWNGHISFITPWGDASLRGSGLGQEQADILDFIRGYSEEVALDGAGNAVMCCRPSLFATLKELDPGSIVPVFYAHALKLMHSSIEIQKPNGGKKSFSICTLCEFDPEEFCGKKPDKPKPVPPHKRVKDSSGDKVFVEAKKGANGNKKSRLYMRLTKEFIEFIGSFVAVDYSALYSGPHFSDISLRWCLR